MADFAGDMADAANAQPLIPTAPEDADDLSLVMPAISTDVGDALGTPLPAGQPAQPGQPGQPSATPPPLADPILAAANQFAGGTPQPNAQSADPILDAANIYSTQAQAPQAPSSPQAPSPRGFLSRAWQSAKSGLSDLTPSNIAQNVEGVFTRDTWDRMLAAAKGNALSTGGGMLEMLGNLNKLAQTNPTARAAMTTFGDLFGNSLLKLNALQKPGAAMAAEGQQATAQADRPGEPWLPRQVIGAVGSIPQFGAAIGAGAIGGPEAAAGVFGATSGGQSFEEAKQAKVSLDTQYANAAENGIVSMLLQRLPVGTLLKKGAPLMSRLAHYVGAALPANVGQAALTQLISQANNVRKPLNAQQWRGLVRDSIAQTLLTAGPFAFIGHGAAAARGTLSDGDIANFRAANGLSGEGLSGPKTPPPAPQLPAGDVVDRAAQAGTEAATAAKAQASVDPNVAADPRYKAAYANATQSGMDPAAADTYARQAAASDRGATAGLAATAQAMKEPLQAAATNAAGARDFSAMVKQAKQAGVDVNTLRAVSQAVIRREIGHADGIAHLQQAIAALTPEAPETSTPATETSAAPAETKAAPVETSAAPAETTPRAPEPALAAGHVRYYHGGAPEGVNGPLWFTTSRDDAEGWASRAPGMGVHYVDVPEDHSARGEGDIANGIPYPSRVELPPELANQRKSLTSPGEASVRPSETAPLGPAAERSPEADAAGHGLSGELAAPAAPEQSEQPVAPEPAAPPAPKARRRNQLTPDPTRDNALQFIAKSGGIDIKEAESEGFDPADMKAQSVGIKRAFHSKGMSIESAGEALAQGGWPVTDAGGAVDKDKVLQVIDDGLHGRPRYSNYRDMDQVAADTQAEQQFRQQHEQEATEAIPEYPEQEEPVRDFTALRMEAEKYASPDEIETAMDTQSDLVAEQRLRDIIARGREADENGPRSEPQTDATGEVGTSEGAGASQLAPHSNASGEEAAPAAASSQELTLSGGALPPREASRAPAPRPTDLFGAAPVAEQALADEQRRRDEARNSGQQSLETGDAGDMFSQSRHQTDLAQQEAPRETAASTPDEKAVAAFRDRLASPEGRYRSIVEARQDYQRATGIKVDASNQKHVDELLERAVTEHARDVAQTVSDPHTAYGRLVDLYDRQPKLGTRTSTSVANQAYSTPAPLAYLADHLAGIDHQTTVYEPTAGNGMLLLTADPAKTRANELDPARAKTLEAQGFKPTVGDALDPANQPKPKSMDVVIANPPFGAVRGENGQSKLFQTQLPDGGKLNTTNVDFAIALKALEAMKDNGRAALIIGSVAKTAKSPEARSDAYNGSARRKFFYHLQRNYNLVDHFTVAGELYEKQGAGWPVDVLVIEGRGPSARPLPASLPPRVYTDWKSLGGLLEQSRVGQRGSPAEADSLGAGPEGARAAALGDSGEAGPAHHPEPVPVVSRGENPGAAQRLPESGGGSEGAPEGPVGRGSVSGSGVGAAAGSGLEPGGNEPGNAGAAGQLGSAAERQPSPARDASGEGSAQRGESGPDGERPHVGGSPTPAAVTDAAQVPYRPASKAPAIGTLVPRGMQTAVADSLQHLERDVGQLNDYVAKALGYDPDDIGKYFSAEQVDALSLALDQIGKGAGFIIGDQTGIGKGRVVAGIIRYALRNGMTPIFVTEKPNLYADMYRDLKDIGQKDVRPVMTNADQKVPLDESGDLTLKTPASARHNANLTAMANEAKLGDYNMVFTTYNQMQTQKGEQTARQRFLQALAPNSVVIFDEAHNAGGSDTERKNSRQKAQDGDTTKTGRAAFARGLVGAAKGVFYSSATYAKRPSVMDLYFKTDMAKAVEGDVRALPAAIQSGGVPLQQVVAAMLTQAGQYIRRERSFSGVEYNTPVVPVDRKAAEAISAIMLGVKEFDDLKQAAVEALKKEAKASASAVSESGGATGRAGVESTNFTSIMHNVIDQMLLALKSDAAADRAIEALRRGEKPVVTVANTMGSFLESYADEAGLKGGDAIGLSFGDLLKRYLERSRVVTIKGPEDQRGGGKEHRLTDKELGPVAVSHFKNVMKLIDKTDAINSVPVSPIDWIHHRLKQAGYSSSEITGRTATVQYGGPQGPAYRPRSGKETSIAARRKVNSDFNSGKLDALVLNQAGSTGISLHASEKFADQRRRRMIIAQAERNIDTHMQMLGRVHRTGQVIAPAYDQMTADIPSEKRPAAVLAKKMASLNANTTASRSSQFTAKDTVDFLNPYGDEVVAQLMEDMPDIHSKLGRPLEPDGDGLAREDAARKVSGRIPLLKVPEQEALYDLIESSYQEAIERADALGENALEAKTLPLEAKRLARTELFSGHEGDSSPFAAGAYADTMDVKRIGKPFTSEQVREQVAEKVGAEKGAPIEQLARIGREKQEDLIRSTNEEYQQYRTGEESKMLSGDMSEQARTGRLTALDGQRGLWQSAMEKVHIGGQYRLTLPDKSELYGVVTDIRRKKSVKMPVALGAWNVHFALADGSRSVTIPLSKINASNLPNESKIAVTPAKRHELTGETVMGMFDSGQSTSRERRVVVNGNLLAGFSKVKRGQIVQYTTDDGRLEQGILMPRTFDLADWSEAQPVELKGEQLPRFFEEAPQGIVRSADGNFEVKRLGSDFIVSTPKSKAQGAKYYLDDGLRQIVGDFTSSGNMMRAKVDPETMQRAAEYVESQLGEPLRTETFKDEAKAAGGKPLGGTKGEDAPALVAARTNLREDRAEYGTPQAQAPRSEIREGNNPPSGKAGAGAGRPGPEVYGNAARPVAATAAAKILSRVSHVKTGRFTTSLTHINKWEDAAHLIAPLRKSAQEQMVAIVLDGENRPLAVLRHAIGNIDQVVMNASVMAGAAARMPRAASVYLAHNHPSGSLMPSIEDDASTKAAQAAFSAAGVKLNGMLIVAPGRTQATFFEPGGFPFTRPITAANRRGNEVPQVERQYSRIPKDNERFKIPEENGTGRAIRAIEQTGEKQGVLLLNRQGEVVGIKPYTDEQMRSIQRDSKSSADLMTAIEQSNAVDAVPFGSPEGMRQTAHLLSAAGITLPHTLERVNGTWSDPWASIRDEAREKKRAARSKQRTAPASSGVPRLTESDEEQAQRAEDARQDGDDAALGRALGAMKAADPAQSAGVGPTVREILAKRRVEPSDQPAMDDAVARLTLGEAAAGAIPEAASGPRAEDPEITAIRRRVMANAKYEGLPLMQRARLLTQRWTGLSALAFRQGVFDSFASIAAYERMLNDGELLDASVSPYKQTVATQNLPSVMTAVMHTGVPVYQDGAYQRATDGRKGLLQIFAPLLNHEDGNLLPQWELYAAARRAARLIGEKNDDGSSREKLFTQEDIDRSLQLAEQYPEFDDVFNDWQDFNHQVLDLAEEAGLIDPASRAVWEKNDYVPFHRAIQQLNGTVNPSALTKAISEQTARIRTLKGGAQPLEDVFEAMLGNTAHLIDASFKNRAAQHIVTMFDGVATSRHPLDREGVQVDVPQVRRALKNAGINLAENLTPEQKDQWLTFFRGVKPAGNNIISVRFNGKPQYYEVHDPLLYQSITQMAPDGVERLLRQLGFTQVKRFVTRMATALPSFLVRNFVRDTMEAWVQNHIGLTPFVSAAKGMGTALRDEFRGKDKIVHDLMLAGAGGDAVYDNQPGNIKKILQRQLKQYNESDIERFVNSVVSPRRAWGVYTALQQASENANRIAIYKAVRARGGTTAEAAYQAHDLLNFQQHGAYAGIRLAIGVLPFLNARIQAFDRLVRSYQANRGSFLLKGAMLVGLTMACMALGGDNPQYEQIEDWDRDTYWHFYTGNTHWRIPKPFELGTLFGTLPERAIRLMLGKDTWHDTGQSIVRALADTFALNPIPPIARPILEDVTNYDFFTGKPVVPGALQDKIAPLQSEPYTSPTLTALSRSMPDWAPDTLRSPVRLQHFIQGYTSAVGIEAFTMADRLTRAYGGYPDAPSKPWYEQWVPAAPATTTPPRNTRWIDELYRMQQSADQAAKAVTDYAKSNDFARARQIAQDRRQQIALKVPLDNLVKQMRTLNAQATRVMESRMSAQMKQQMIDKINVRRADIARQVAPYAGRF